VTIWPPKGRTYCTFTSNIHQEWLNITNFRIYAARSSEWQYQQTSRIIKDLFFSSQQTRNGHYESLTLLATMKLLDFAMRFNCSLSLPVCVMLVSDISTTGWVFCVSSSHRRCSCCQSSAISSSSLSTSGSPSTPATRRVLRVFSYVSRPLRRDSTFTHCGY